MRHHTTSVLMGPILSLALLAGCASSPSGGEGVSTSDRDALTLEEIRASNQSDAYSLVRSVRPQWLRHRGPRSINLSNEIVIYMDGTPIGGPDALRQIPLTDVTSMRYLDPNTATQRYGTGHGMGAILVSTR